MQHKKLVPSDVYDNHAFLLMLAKKAGVSFDERTDLLKHFVDLMSQHAITLDHQNLNQAEENALQAILLETFQKKLSLEEISHKIATWQQTLRKAKVGEGEHVLLHTRSSSGFVHDLETGFIPAKKWGTDLDFEHCLNEMIISVQDIKQPGMYVLNPISISERIEGEIIYPFQDLLHEILQHIENFEFKEKVTLYIPLNHGNYHWRLAQITIENQKIASVVLQDQGKANPDIVRTASFQIFEKTVRDLAKVEPQVKFRHLQNNGHDCMVYVTRSIFAAVKPDHRIATTNPINARELRLAVVQETVSNVLGSEVASSLMMNPDGSIGRDPAADEHEIRTQIKAFLEIVEEHQQTNLQIEADNILAHHWQRHLNELYSKPENRNLEGESANQAETSAFDTALINTVKDSHTIRLFSQAKQPIDNNPEEQHILRIRK